MRQIGRVLGHLLPAFPVCFSALHIGAGNVRQAGFRGRARCRIPRAADQRLVLQTRNSRANETGGFFARQGAGPEPYGVYGKGVQHSMAKKDAISCFVISGL
jgi:hypothetical protein